MALFSHRPPPSDKPALAPSSTDLARRGYVDALRLSIGMSEAATDFLTYMPWSQIQSHRDALRVLAPLFATALHRMNESVTVGELCDLLSEVGKRDAVRDAIQAGNDKAQQ